MAYLFHRILQMAVVLFLVSLIVFFVIRLRGDPVMHLAPPTATPAQIEQMRRAYGFDRPVHTQYFEFLNQIRRGDFGESFRFRGPAMPLVLERLPVTITLAASAIGVALLIAVPLGLISAVRPNSPADLLATGISVLGRALPDYWVGIMLMLIFAVSLGWLPVSGIGTARHLVLPAVTLGTSLATVLTRMIRSAMLEVIRQDYIVTARSKGLAERTVYLKHALRNALIPVVTVFALHVAWLLGGAVVVEQVFSLPGLGQLMIRAVMLRDMAVVQAGVFVFALVVLVVNLAVDLLYLLINPRIRYG